MPNLQKQHKKELICVLKGLALAGIEFNQKSTIRGYKNLLIRMLQLIIELKKMIEEEEDDY